MNRKSRFLGSIAALATTAVLAGCTAVGVTSTGASTTSSATKSSTTTATAATALSGTASVQAARAANATPDAADVTYDASKATTITLSGSTAAASGSGVSISGSTVRITAGGTYVLSGTLNGQVIVDSATSDEVKLVLNGATITSSTGSAIAFVDAGEAVVVLADSTTNALTDAASYADTTSADAPDAALFSMADLTIGGAGTLNVTGRFNDGIVSKDGLVISSGTITVTATHNGIRGKDHLVVTGGTIAVTAGNDALKSNNTTDADSGFIDVSGGTLTLAAGAKGDGLDAQNDIIVSDGKITVTKAYEGLEALNIVLGGGTTEVTTSDDGINVSAGASSTTTTQAAGGPGGGGGDAVIDGTAAISGGTLLIHAGGDGFDSNGTTSITGGTVVVDQVGQANGALDVNGTFTISGGTLIALGDASMPVAPGTASPQGWLMAAASGAAGAKIQILSGSTVVAEFTAPRVFGNVVYSSDKITSGQAYTVTVNGAATSVTADTAIAGGPGGGGMHGPRG